VPKASWLGVVIAIQAHTMDFSPGADATSKKYINR
jgi:hypothetical protein